MKHDKYVSAYDYNVLISWSFLKNLTTVLLSTPASSSTSISTALTTSTTTSTTSTASTTFPVKTTTSSTLSFWSSQYLGQIVGDTAGDQSGYAIALAEDGMTLAVGAPLNNINGQDSGMVQVYHMDSNDLNWSKQGQSIVGDEAEDYMGLAVALSSDGSILAVGASGSSGNEYASGQVKIYTWNNDELLWVLDETLHGESSLDQLGAPLSLSRDGKTLAVGAPWSDQRKGIDSGYVRVYQKNEESIWNGLGQVIYGDVAGVELGGAVSLSSDASTLAIGVAFNDENGQDSGKVLVYRWNESVARWNQRGVSILGDFAGDQAGQSVALSADGNVLAIGAHGNDANSETSGVVKVYIWVHDQSNWEQLGQDINGEAAGDTSGWSVSLSGDGKTL